MTEITWSNGQGHRDRQSCLLLVGPGDRCQYFNGSDIPGIVSVKGSTYHKDYNEGGKWSYTTYCLETAEGVTAIGYSQGWEKGTESEGLRDALKAPSENPEVLAQYLKVSQVSLVSAVAVLAESSTSARGTLEEWISWAKAKDILKEEPPPPPPVTEGPMAEALRKAGLID